MPHSLRCKIKHLCHNGTITESERDRILVALDQGSKTGHWEWVQYDYNPKLGNWHCSECNRIVSGAITAVNPVYAYKYCPDCGVKMESEDKDGNNNL